MNRRVLAVLAITLMVMSCMTLPLAVAQSETEDEPSELLMSLVTFGEVMLAWIVYALAGMFDAVINGHDFDGKRFTWSFLVAFVVGIFSSATGLAPQVIWESHGDAISMILTTLLEAGVFIPLIYLFIKVCGILKGVWQRCQKLFGKT